MPKSNEEKPCQARRYGFKETREERDQRIKMQKQEKWKEQLDKEDLEKLRTELDSLTRARFLAPQQNERKRLVVRMVRDLEDREAEKEKSVAAINQIISNHSENSQIKNEEDDDKDQLFDKSGFICIDDAPDIDSRAFIPRSVKERITKRPKHEDLEKSQLAEAEQLLLNAAGSDDDEDIDTFLESL